MSYSFKEANRFAKERIERVLESKEEYAHLVQQIDAYSAISKTTHVGIPTPLRPSLETKPKVITLASIHSDLHQAEERKRLLATKLELKNDIKIVTVLLCLHNTKLIIDEHRHFRTESLKKKIAARRISRWYKQILIKKRESQKIWAIAKLLPILYSYCIRKRSLKRQNCALIAYSFILDTYNSGILINLVHTYQAKVIRCQSIIRTFLCRKKSKLELRILQLDNFDKKNSGSRKRRKSVFSISQKAARIQCIQDLMRKERKEDIQKLLFNEHELVLYFEQ